MNASLTTRPKWQGAHHLALVTRDLDATVRFYHGLLGMPLWAAMGPMLYHGRHCFFKAGHFLMHFFEEPNAEIATPPSDWMKKRVTFIPGAYQHIALALDDEESLVALRARLVTAGVDVTEMMEQGPILQFLFSDNNGIILEANWTPFDMIEQPIDYSSSQLFNDPNPVPAVQEIMQTGYLNVSRFENNQ
jgi:catechol 2,3-dioxygenase-like lactoylglutathione lyase family enzyme